MNATATDTQQKTEAGTRVATIGRDGARMAKTGSGYSDPIWTGKVYEAQPRQSDGVLTWRLMWSFGGTRSGRVPSVTFAAELEKQSDHDWYDYDEGIRHGAVCK